MTSVFQARFLFPLSFGGTWYISEQHLPYCTVIFSFSPHRLFIFLKNIFIDYAVTVVPFPAPLTPLHPAHPLPPTFPSYSSCPWVILIRFLASTFPTLFLPSPYFPPILYATYSLYLYPPLPLPLPYWQPSRSSCLPSLLSFLFYVWSLITVSLLSFLLFLFLIFFFLGNSL